MPPQQPCGLLDFGDNGLDFGAHDTDFGCQGRKRYWFDSNIRVPLRQAAVRMLESKDHQQIMSVQWSSGFGIRVADPRLVWHRLDSSCGLLNQSHTRTIHLLVSFRFRSSQPIAPHNHANFGIGTLGLAANVKSTPLDKVTDPIPQFRSKTHPRVRHGRRSRAQYNPPVPARTARSASGETVSEPPFAVSVPMIE